MTSQFQATEHSYITIVTGLPRSGTSMMMQLLHAGGMPVATDELRLPDEDNPKGYFELEAVKQLPASTSFEWLEDLRGKAVKMIFLLLYHLPAYLPYKVIMLHRDMGEVLMSQRTMLAHKGKPPSTSDTHLAEIYCRELRNFESWLQRRQEIPALHLNYRELLHEPLAHMEKIESFLRRNLDTTQMKNAIDVSLYRCRLDYANDGLTSALRGYDIRSTPQAGPCRSKA
jgi:hypothetical protein